MTIACSAVKIVVKSPHQLFGYSSATVWLFEHVSCCPHCIAGLNDILATCSSGFGNGRSFSCSSSSLEHTSCSTSLLLSSSRLKTSSADIMQSGRWSPVAPQVCEKELRSTFHPTLHSSLSISRLHLHKDMHPFNTPAG